MSIMPAYQNHTSAQSLSLLRSLIAFDTTSRNSNLDMIEWIRDYLQQFGVQSRLTYDKYTKKANLFATVGEGFAPGIILSGHTDVVPVDGQDWTTDPFGAEIRGGRLYGRGSCDMKGFIACALAAVPKVLASPTNTPIHFAFSYDEEVGCLGVRSLLADLAEQNIRAAACIVGEPTEMQAVVGQKGRREMRCCVRGKEAHSSLPEQGVNAIEYGAQIIAFAQRLAIREAAKGPQQAEFDVPYNTLQCGTTSGGLSTNTIPRDNEFSLELRYLPRTDANGVFNLIQSFIDADVLPAMRRLHPQTSVELTLVNDTPAFEIPVDSPLVQLVQKLTNSTKHSRVAYNTEAGLFQSYGIPTVICGPGNIEQAHRPDEYIEVDQIVQCDCFLTSLIEKLRGGPALGNYPCSPSDQEIT